MDEGFSLLSKPDPTKKVAWVLIILATVVVIAAFTSTLVVSIQYSKGVSNSNSADFSCPASGFSNGYNSFRPTGPNVAPSDPIAIISATIWPATGNPAFFPGCILMRNGLIEYVGYCSSAPDYSTYTIFDVQGRYVTPGLVDMHSHMGVSAIPYDFSANSDENEMTNPIFPQVRAVDGFNPEDPAIPSIRSGGVTTSLVLPGSGNIMGGEAVYVKLRGRTVGDMLVPNVPRALKMACGENPKRFYGSKGVTPMTRMGNAWLMRQSFFAAAQLKQAQEQWDCLNAKGMTSDPRPQNLSLESLVALLNGQVNLNVHCYRVEDFEMMIRLSKEFGFQVAAFHHALEAYKIPDILRENNISVATFADLWGFKVEAYEASVWGPNILDQAGVNLALKSDHPVSYAKYLIRSAARAHSYGLSEESALKSVTINPARSIGLGDRIGSLEQGKEADVVVWDRYPLSYGAHVDKVFINGVLIDNFNMSQVNESINPQVHLANCNEGPTVVPKFAVTGVTVYTMDSNNTTIYNATILVDQGIISCLGQCTLTNDYVVYNLPSGIVTPGIIALSWNLGTSEIDAESSSGDGSAVVSDGSSIQAYDAIQFQAYERKKLHAAWAGGITTIIAQPTGFGLMAGIGTAFNPVGRFLGDKILNFSNIVLNRTHLYVMYGNVIKQAGDPMAGSISGQMAEIRTLLASNQAPFPSVVSGQLPMAVETNQADEIAAIIRLKQEFPQLNIIIIGGAQSYIIADLLAQQTPPIAVVMDDFTITVVGGSYETWNFSPNSSAILQQAGVPVVFTSLDGSMARNIRWIAGAAVSEGLPYIQALASITRTPARLFFGQSTLEGTIQQGQPSNFVAFSGDPLSLQSTVELVVIKGSVGCKPKQL